MSKKKASEIPRFSEVYQGEWKTQGNLSDIEGKEIIIKKVDFVEGVKGEAALIELEDDIGTYRVHTFSKVVIKQLKAILEKLPVKATVKKVKNYYTLA